MLHDTQGASICISMFNTIHMDTHFKTKIDFENSPNHKHSTAVLIVSFRP